MSWHGSSQTFCWFWLKVSVQLQYIFDATRISWGWNSWVFTSAGRGHAKTKEFYFHDEVKATMMYLREKNIFAQFRIYSRWFLFTQYFASAATTSKSDFTAIRNPIRIQRWIIQMLDHFKEAHKNGEVHKCASGCHQVGVTTRILRSLAHKRMIYFRACIDKYGEQNHLHSIVVQKCVHSGQHENTWLSMQSDDYMKPRKTTTTTTHAEWRRHKNLYSQSVSAAMRQITHSISESTAISYTNISSYSYVKYSSTTAVPIRAHMRIELVCLVVVSLRKKNWKKSSRFGLSELSHSLASSQ